MGDIRRLWVSMEGGTMEPEKETDFREVSLRRVERWRLFLSEVRNELKRVTWPSRREVYGTTVVVIVTSIILGA
jgi:preprotein translocase subunit SecE